MATTITKTLKGLNWGSNGITDGTNSSENVTEFTNNSFKIKLGMGTPGRRYFTINRETVLGNNATLIKVVANFSGYTTQNRDHGVYIWGDKTAYSASTADDSTKFTTTLQSGYSLETTDLYLTDSGKYTVYLGAGGKTILANTAYFSNVSFDLTCTVPGYTLTVNSNNTAYGTVTGGGDYESGATATLTATPKTGYKFVKWSDGNTSASRTVTVSADKTYTATFEAATCTATFKNHDGTVLETKSVSSGSVPTYTGATPTKPSTAQYSYTFSGWSPSLSAITANTTYTAQFTSAVRSYVITVDAGTGGTVSGGNTYNYGATVTLTATANAGYKFKQWNDGDTNATRTITVTGAATYTATFEKTAPEFTSASITYSGSQVSASNKVIAGQGYVISMGVT